MHENIPKHTETIVTEKQHMFIKRKTKNNNSILKHRKRKKKKKKKQKKILKMTQKRTTLRSDRKQTYTCNSGTAF